MKPSSIIFLIISLILIVGGVITCMVANAMAKSDGIPMFSQTQNPDGSLLYVCEYEPQDINRIELTIDHANVNVIASNEDKIELINFTEGSYSRGISSQAYIVDENFSLSQFFVFDEGGFSFNGLRQYFRNFSFKSKEKTINVHISSETIKSISIVLKKGAVSIDNLSLTGDFNISVTNGSINLNEVHTDSYVKLSGDTSSAKITGCSMKNFEYIAKTGELIAESLAVNSAKVQLESGDTTMSLLDELSTYMIESKTENGKITADGTDYNSILLQGEENEDRKLDIKTKNGKIVLSGLQ